MIEPLARRRPAVTLKLAQTLDGRIATATGHSRWVSGPESRMLAHRLRTENDAVLVGIGTVLADDPRLNARLWDGPDPVRVVLDSRLRVPLDAAVLQCDDPGAIIATGPAADMSQVSRLEARGIRILQLPAGNEGIDVRALLDALWGLGIASILVEGGARVATSFLRAHAVDHLTVIVAPKIAGKGIEAIGDLGIADMGDSIVLSELEISRSGDDVVFSGKPVWRD